MFAEYQRKCSAGLIRPGRLHIWQTPDGERIVNVPTKRHWRDKSRYEDIEAGLIALRAFLADQGLASVTLPALGCGHGRLNWKVVAAMIAKHLQGLQAQITVFQPSDSRTLTN
jgi:O-acetyl-ADP-ribose deacetylase (regulator of RNase III)